jgi:hypothetical protein
MNLYEELTPRLCEFIANQKMFFVATAPLSADGHVNVSPKGHDTFRILDRLRVAYLDLSGSGVETIAHIRENRRIVFMFCAFEGPPKIVRLYGHGRVVTPGEAEFEQLLVLFPELPGVRGIIIADLHRLTGSCGFSVPLYEFVGERDQLTRWANKKGPDWLAEYRVEHNARSIDDLPALDPGK